MKRDRLYLSTIDPQAGDLARSWGLGLEIAEFCTAWNLDDRFGETDPKVRSELRDIPRATFHCPYNELYPCAIDPRARALAADRYLQAMKVARGYGIKKLVIHAGFDPHLYFPQWFVPQSVIFFRNLLPLVPSDTELCLENVLEPQPSLILDILRQVDDPRLKMCLDVGHAQAYSELAPIEWVRQCRDHLSHFHIHNNNGLQDQHGALWDGVIPMEALLSEIQSLCPQGTLTLELPSAESSLVWLREKKILEEEL